MVLWRRWTACKDAWRRQRPATHVACHVAGLGGLYGRAAAENKGRYGIIASHRLDGRAVSAADALRNVTGGERTRRGVWNYHQGDAERHGRRDGSSRCEKKMHRVKYIEKKLILKPHILNFRLRRYQRPQSGPGCRIDWRSGKSALL